MRMLQGVNLTDQQKAQIRQLMTNYRQAHPQGSQPDPQARKQLHEQIMSILTPAQQAQVRANMERMHSEHQMMMSPQPSASP
jgi:Spy/CpxP family protein refolding chaperone